MAPVTKSAFSKFIIGQPSSVLDSTWQEALHSGSLKDSCNLLPFKGKARLPTREQTLLLYFAFREVKEFKLKGKAEIAEMTASEVVKYWSMAPIQTVSMRTIQSRILKLLDEHDALLRNKSRSSSTEENKRETFKESIQKLFDIASPVAEKVIEQNRFLAKKDSMGNLITKDRDDDLSFLQDQRGPRIGWMREKDKVYEKRVGDKDARKEKEDKGENERQLKLVEANKNGC